MGWPVRDAAGAGHHAFSLEIQLPALPCRGGSDLAREVVRAARLAGDGRPPGRWIRSFRSGVTRAMWICASPAGSGWPMPCNHLYVLLPVLDDAKHYWVSPDEVDKLIRAGGDWLADHPGQDLITNRYLRRRSSLTAGRAGPAGRGRRQPTLGRRESRPTRLLEAGRPCSLAVQRRDGGARRAAGARCAPGRRSRVRGGAAGRRAADGRGSSTRSSATDVSARALTHAERRLHAGRDVGPAARAAASCSSRRVTYADDAAGRAGRRRADGGDRARRPAAAAALWRMRSSARRAPGAVVVTTPNAEHNVRFETLAGRCVPAPAITGSSGRGRSSATGRRRCRVHVRVRACAFRAGRAGRSRGRAADPARACSDAKASRRDGDRSAISRR